jgi:hypothetical protein
VLYTILKRGALLPIAPVVCRLTMRTIAVWFKDTPVGSPRQCADFVGQWREELLASDVVHSGSAARSVRENKLAAFGNRDRRPRGEQKCSAGRWGPHARDVAVNLKVASFQLRTAARRGVDAGAIVEIPGLIQRPADEGKAVVVISSCLPEITALSDRILASRQGKVVEEFSALKATEEKIMYSAVHQLV